MIEVQKNSREVIRVSRKTYKDKEYVDMRIFIKTYDDREYIPTKKGLMVPPESAKELLKALQSLV